MTKQLTKLVKVRYVEDVTDAPRLGAHMLLLPLLWPALASAYQVPRCSMCIAAQSIARVWCPPEQCSLAMWKCLAQQCHDDADRELALFKMQAAHGTSRSEILELTTIFRGKVVDVGPSGLTIALSGDPGKLFAFEQAMRPFGLAQLTRTGRIALQRSDQNLDMPGTMAYAPARQPPLHAPQPADNGARIAPLLAPSHSDSGVRCDVTIWAHALAMSAAARTALVMQLRTPSALLRRHGPATSTGRWR